MWRARKHAIGPADGSVTDMHVLERARIEEDTQPGPGGADREPPCRRSSFLTVGAARAASDAPAATPAATASTPSPDRAQHDPKAAPAPTGFELSLGTSARFLQGATARGASDFNALGIGVAVAGHYYVSRHVGLAGGIDIGVGSVMKGCNATDDDSCDEAGLSVPLVVEYAVEGRTHGPYVTAGVSLANVEWLHSDAQSYRLFSPIDGTLGAGYRFDEALFANGRTGFDLGFRATAGRYTSVSDGTTTASLDSSQRAFHVAVTTTMAVRF